MPVGDDNDIEIIVTLRDEFSREAERVAQAERDIAEGARDASDATDDLTDSTDRNTEAQRRAERQQRANNQARDENGRFIVRVTSRTESETTSIRRNTRERDKGTKSIFKMVKGFFSLGKILNLMKITIIIDGIAKAMAGLSAFGGIGIAAIGGIAPLTGALLPLPALLGGAALGLATLKMGFSGIGEALKAFDPEDMTAFNEAIKDMGPNGQAVATTLGEIKEQLKPLKQAVQETLLDGFSDPINNLASEYLPLLDSALISTAEKLNGTIKIGMGFLELPSTIEQVNGILGNSSKMAELMGHTFNGALRGTIHMFDAVDEVAVNMMDDLSYGMNFLADAISRNRDAIGDFAQKGYNSVKYVVGVIWDLSRAFGTIASIGADILFTGLGKSFHDMARDFLQFTQSAEGQNKIREYFESIKPILDALIRLGAALAGMFGRVSQANMGSIAPMIDSLTRMVPLIENIMNSTSGAFDAFISILENILRVVDSIGLLGPTLLILSSIAPIIQVISDVIVGLPGPIQTLIGYLVTFGLLIRMSAVRAVGAWLMQIRVVRIFVNTMRFALLALRGLVASAIMNGLKAIATGLRVATAAAWGFVAPLLANPITWIVIAVIALIALFVILWKKSETFRNIIKSIGQWFVDVWNNQIYPLVDKVWQWMQMAWDKALGVVKTVVAAIVGFFVGAWNTVKPVIEVIVTIFTTVFNAVKAVVMGVVNVVVAIFTAGWNLMKYSVNAFKEYVWPIIQGIAGLIGQVIGIGVSIFKLGWNIIRLVVNVAITVILLAIAWIAPKVMAVINTVKIIFQTGWEIIKTIVSVAIAIITGIFQAIWATIQAVLNPVIGFFQMVWFTVSTVVGGILEAVFAKIRQIWDIVVQVVSPIVGFFSDKWNQVTGVVGGVIEGIKAVINTLWEKVQTILGSIKSRFESIWGGIRDFVMGIIDRISSALGGIKSVIDTISSGIGKAADLLPGLATGGPVTGGMKALVGEVGPEAFVGANGKVSGIGMNGPEIRKFNQPGFVVPNHALAGVRDSSVPSNIMDKLENALSGGGPSAPTTQEPAEGHGTKSKEYLPIGGGDGGGDHYDFRGANFGGASPSSIKSAVKEAVRESDRNRRERGGR